MWDSEALNINNYFNFINIALIKTEKEWSDGKWVIMKDHRIQKGQDTNNETPKEWGMGLVRRWGD